MADSYLETVAGELADLALADQEASGDISIVDTVAKVLGSSSQTLEEAFLTAVRVRRAEARARALLADRKANNYADAPKPPPAPLQGGDADENEPSTAPAEPAAPATPAAVTGPESTEQPTESLSETEQQAADEALERLKRKGIGMPRRVTR